MASKYVTVEGIMEWAKVFEANRDMEGYKGAFKDTNGRTTLNMILSNEEFAKVTKSGSMKRGKPDPAGRGVAVKFDRKWETGRDWDSGAPEVYRADGNPWSLEEDGEIGNGSYGRVQIVVTPLPDQGVVSTRLEKIKVLDHVKFAGRDDGFTQDESGFSGGASESSDPAPQPPTQQVEAPSSHDLDDQIPF